VDRPLEIVWFERLCIATLVLGVINSWLSWEQLLLLGASLAFGILIQLSVVGIMMGLVLLVSRIRSNIARWAFIVFFALGLLITISNELRDDFPSIGIIGYAQTTMQFIAFMLLFRPASRRWFSKENLPS
jgi:hypothetical protein